MLLLSDFTSSMQQPRRLKALHAHNLLNRYQGNYVSASARHITESSKAKSNKSDRVDTLTGYCRDLELMAVTLVLCNRYYTRDMVSLYAELYADYTRDAQKHFCPSICFVFPLIYLAFLIVMSGSFM